MAPLCGGPWETRAPNTHDFHTLMPGETVFKAEKIGV